MMTALAWFVFLAGAALWAFLLSPIIVRASYHVRVTLPSIFLRSYVWIQCWLITVLARLESFSEK